MRSTIGSANEYHTPLCRAQVKLEAMTLRSERERQDRAVADLTARVDDAQTEVRKLRKVR